MKYIAYYLIVLFVIFLIMYIFSYVLRKKKNRLGNSVGFKFIEQRFKLNMDEKRANTLAKVLVLNDSIILSLPIYIVLFFYDMNSISKMILLFGITFVVFIILIIITYLTIGNVLKKKGW